MQLVEDQTSVTRALVQQSAAISNLVAHLTGGDPLTDLATSSSSSASIHTKGVARRERMQSELALGNSGYFLQVLQQMHRKMYPARPVPKTEAELAGSGVTMTSYLERFVSYKDKTEHGMLMWLLAHVVDAAIEGNVHLMKEHLALTVASLEQASMDGNWSVAYLISLQEEPPSQIFSQKAPTVSALGKPFSPLVPGAWSATALAYLKEVEVLSAKKAEAKAGKTPTPKAGDPTAAPASPPKRPRFPKKPKAKAEPASTDA